MTAENKDKTKKILIAGAVAAGVIWWLSYKPSKQQKDYLKAAQDMLDYLSAEMGIVPSLTNGQFSSLAVQIRKAVDKCGTEENIIYNAMQALNNEADIYKLIVAYGVAKYDGCFEGSLPSWNVHYTLSESLVSDMSDSEINHVNNILSDKGINFRF